MKKGSKINKNVDIRFPLNTKYHSKNPISRILIKNFISSFLFLCSMTDLSGKKILDLGCGEGMILYQISKIWPTADVHGLDIRQDLIAIAKQMVQDAGYLTGNLYELPLKKDSYDIVICTEVLEHLSHPELALKEILRVGKHSFLFSVPNEPWWRLANMVRGAYLSDYGNTPGHLNHWGQTAFMDFISGYVKINAFKCPFPWTMVLCEKDRG